MYPKPTDTDEYKKARMEEFNYNMTVIHCLREAIKTANSLISRQSCPVIGPLSHEKALEFSSLLEKAYVQ